jgi:hypothetical protein
LLVARITIMTASLAAIFAPGASIAQKPYPAAILALQGGRVPDSRPSAVWSTLLGGPDTDRGWAVAAGGSGNVYVAGMSAATWGAPIRAYTGNGDAFVAKLDSSGTLLWNTFLGGPTGDSAAALAVDAGGNVVVAGGSGVSWGAPLRDHAGEGDAFVAKLDTDGNLLWNTFLGGTGGDGAGGIALDSNGNVFLGGASGAAWGSPVRNYSGDSDTFAAKLDQDGILLWNTFLGSSHFDYGNAIAVNGQGHATVAGSSVAAWGDPLQPFSTGFEAFAAGLDRDGHLTWNTFWGGPDEDFGEAITLGRNDGIYAAGYSGAMGDPDWQASVALLGTPASECAFGDGVCLYEQPDYGGAWVRLAGTEGIPDLAAVGFDDTASSIRFAGAYRRSQYLATLYANMNYAGASTAFRADDPDLSDDEIGDNQASSVQIEAVPPSKIYVPCILKYEGGE